MFHQCHSLAVDIIQVNIYKTQVQRHKTKSHKKTWRIFDVNKVVQLIILSVSL